MSYRRIARVSANTWILVADRSKASIYRATWPHLERYELVAQMDNSEELASGVNLLSKGSGRFASFGVTRQAGEPRMNFRRKTAKDFSLEIVQRLEQGRKSNEFGRLIVVAPAFMLGTLRDNLPAPLAKMVTLELRKELTDSPTRIIMEHVERGLNEQEKVMAEEG